MNNQPASGSGTGVASLLAETQAYEKALLADVLGDVREVVSPAADGVAEQVATFPTS
jgi:hypothetical protein